MKKWLLVGMIVVGLIGGLLLCLSVYIDQSLYLSPMSDKELVEMIFPSDHAGFGQVEILSSQGEGLRRIPRTIEVEVRLESYPQPVTCKGQIYWAVGDPMTLGLTWETLACAGQGRYVDLAHWAMKESLTPASCHAERVAALLADWTRRGLIDLEELIYPETRQWVGELAGNSRPAGQLEAWDGGLFDTGRIILREEPVRESGPDSRSTFVLRCDGTVEQFQIDPGYIHAFLEFGGGDYQLPATLIPYQPLSGN